MTNTDNIRETIMNEKYAEIINGLTETLKETKDFVLEQAPDVAKQLLNLYRRNKK